MGRLTTLGPARGVSASGLTVAPDPVARPVAGAPRGPSRDEWAPWRKWYRTARWRALRWATLVRDGFTCRRCGRLEPNPSKLVAHHLVAHRGDPARFWDPENLETQCDACHSGPTQAEERAGA